MNRFKCPACGGNQYTSADTAEGCIYCDNKELKKMEALARRNSMRLIDAVPVVRCKNCKHYNTIGCSKGFGWCENIDRGTSDNFYCAEAAVEMGVQDLRKEEAERLEGSEWPDHRNQD